LRSTTGVPSRPKWPRLALWRHESPRSPANHYRTFPPFSSHTSNSHKDDTQSIHSMNPPTGSLPRRAALPRTVPTPRSLLRGARDDWLWRCRLPSMELRCPLWAARRSAGGRACVRRLSDYCTRTSNDIVGLKCGGGVADWKIGIVTRSGVDGQMLLVV